MRDVKKYPPPCSENLGLAVLRHASECAAGVGVGVGGGGGQVRAFTEANGEGGRAAAIVASLPTALPTEAETAAAGFALTEAARAQALAVRLNKLLDSFPTTVEEDERLLTQNLVSRSRPFCTCRGCGVSRVHGARTNTSGGGVGYQRVRQGNPATPPVAR